MKKNKNTNLKFPRKVYLILLALLLVAFLAASLTRYFDHDEFETIHTVWKIVQGERIYVDFFQHHHPFFYYLLAPFVLIFRDSILTLFAARVFIFFLTLLILASTYLLGRKIFNSRISFLAIILLATTFIFNEKVVEIRTDTIQTLFSLASLVFLFDFLENGKARSLILSGAGLGFSFLFLQKAIFLIFLVCLLLLYYFWQRKISGRHLLIFGLSFLLTLFPYIVYLLLTKNFSTYLFFNWVFNFNFVGHFYPFRHLAESFRENSLLWIFCAWGCLVFLKTHRQKNLAFLSLGLLLSLFFVRVPLKQYFMTLMPLIALISSQGLYFTFKNNQKLLLIIFLFLTVPFIYSSLKPLETTINRNQLALVKDVLQATNEEDFVYDGSARFNLFRKDIDFFWFSVNPTDSCLATYKKLRPCDYDINELIEEKKPKIVSTYPAPVDLRRLEKHYKPFKNYPNVFIRIN